MVTVIYDALASWERDYILCDLLGTIENKIVKILSDAEITNEQFYQTEIVNRNIFVFSSNEKNFSEIKKIVDLIKPLVIIHLSDEWGQHPEYLSLSDQVKLYLRQHNCIQYKPGNEVIQIPLGYMTNMLQQKSCLNTTIIPIKERSYTWSFIGALKQDREQMISTFSQKLPNGYVNNQITPQDMYHIYSKSIFVLNGRGNVSLDCFRIYEAIIAGAIPVIVGDPDEINHVFSYNGQPPPFLSATTWDEAVIKCQELLKDEETLFKVLEANRDWFKNKITEIQEKIGNAVCL